MKTMLNSSYTPLKVMAYRLATELEGRTVRFDLRPGENMVGSDPSCEVRLEHPAVSRHHAVLVALEDRVELADLGSSNGTLIDGRKLRSKVRLGEGVEICFGAVTATVEHLEEDDVRPAKVTEFFPSQISPEDPPSVQPTTASLGPLQVFALGHLPRLIGSLGDGLSGVEMAQRIGAAMWMALPCRELEIVSRSEEDQAVLFHSGRSSAAEEEEAGSSLDAAGLRMVVVFESASAKRLYEPLLRIGIGLLALADSRSRAVSQPARVVGEAPPVPDPPSVDPQVQAIYERAATVAQGDITVLIRGGSGTGKEILASYIHRASSRPDGPFVALNCAALPRDLQETELFGVERGVATGVEARPGKFEQADGGTLFLDEIGDMALEVQAKILRVLQEGEVYRLGAQEPRPARVRVLSATNRDLDAMLSDETFRGDLYHRIADWEVALPDLRDRRADIPNLAAYFLQREAEKLGRSVRGISRAALRTLSRHDWPGNIRQLEREVARAILFVSDGDLLDTGCLDDALKPDGDTSPGGSLKEFLERAERDEIARALHAAGGDVNLAADELQISASTLYRKIKSFGFEFET